jgi:hypothetical protein
MTELFASFYDTLFGIWNQNFPLIFSTLFDYGGYLKLGMLFLLLPLFWWLMFYFAWRYPYGRFWHWFLWLVISALAVFACSYGLAHAEIFASENQALADALNDPESGYQAFASGLPVRYAWANTLSAVVLGFVYSLIMKQFSKIQMHLPF